MRTTKFDKILTKKFLHEKYVVEKLGTYKIGQLINASDETVRFYLKKHKIAIRKQGTIEQDLVGQVFGVWSVIQNIGRKNAKSRLVRYLCKCSCGKEKILLSSKLRKNAVKSCGCQNRGKLHWKWKGGEYISGTLFKNIQSGANIRNIEFNITLEYIDKLYKIQKQKCALTGWYIYDARVQINRNTVSTASLDRIDSSKGYVEGNVQWVHKDINKIKWELSQEHFIKLCVAVAEYQSKL